MRTVGVLLVLLVPLIGWTHPVMREFAATGTVISSSSSRDFIIQDANEYTYLYNKLPSTPRRGDLVAVRGYIEIGLDHCENHCVTGLDRLGEGDLPSPEDVTLGQILEGRFLYHLVRTTGLVVSAAKDEVDPAYSYLILKSGQDMLQATFPDAGKTNHFSGFIGTTVRVTGICHPNLGGRRIFIHNHLNASDPSQIEILTPAPDDNFDVPEIESSYYTNPRLIVSSDRRRASGTVTAVWGGGNFLLRTVDGRDIRVSLAADHPLPRCGTRVHVIGLPDTDLFHINLTHAEFRSATNDFPVATLIPVDLSADKLLLDAKGRNRFNVDAHGQLVRLCGTIRGNPLYDGRINLECGSFTIPLDISAIPETAQELVPGSTVEAIGVCILETDSWRPNVIVPQIRGIMLVTRSPEDIRVLARPPWWTPRRLLIVIGSLITVLVGILIWNRILNRLVERRSRQLFREQVARSSSELKVDERTRLAVELHDTLSQKLAGVAYQIASLHRSLKTRPDAAARLQTAERMLSSCRTELRHCLFDLRSDTLEVKDFPTAILTCLGELEMSATVDIDFPVDRTRLHDATAHAVLCIIRELASNAFRHGHATSISVRGRLQNGVLAFSVKDNGCGFDMEDHPGVADGHFGLHGIGERIKRLRGTFTVESVPGRGTTATCEIQTGRSEMVNES